MNLTGYSIICTLAVTLAAPSLAFADNGKKRGDKRHGKRFEKVDINKDGKINLNELVKSASLRFNNSDTNKDGEISLEELTDRIQRRRDKRRAKRILSRMDFNGDGKVTKDEIENRAKKRFALLDRNDDGGIDKTEMRRGKRRGHGDRGGRKHRKRDRKSDNSDL